MRLARRLAAVRRCQAMAAGRIGLAQVPLGNAVKAEEQVIVASVEMLARTGHQCIDVVRIVVVGLLDVHGHVRRELGRRPPARARPRSRNSTSRSAGRAESGRSRSRLAPRASAPRGRSTDSGTASRARPGSRGAPAAVVRTSLAGDDQRRAIRRPDLRIGVSGLHGALRQDREVHHAEANRPGASSTRPSMRNSRRYRRTSGTDGESGEPRLTRRTAR